MHRLGGGGSAPAAGQREVPGLADPTLVPAYTGNNVLIQITPNGATSPTSVALCQGITISRMVGRNPIYATGTPYWANAPVGQIGVQVSVATMVPVAGGLPTSGVVPGESLTESLTDPYCTITVVDLSGNPIGTIINAAFQQDSMAPSANDPIGYNASWIAQDSSLI